MLCHRAYILSPIQMSYVITGFLDGFVYRRSLSPVKIGGHVEVAVLLHISCTQLFSCDLGEISVLTTIYFLSKSLKILCGVLNKKSPLLTPAQLFSFCSTLS